MSDSVVYFIKPVGMAGPIKIGCSRHPQSRLMGLASWSPFDLEIIATVPGDVDLERQVQNCFFDLHIRHEWFTAAPRLVDAIEKLKAGLPLDQAVDLTDVRGDIVASHYAKRSRLTAIRRGKLVPEEAEAAA